MKFSIKDLIKLLAGVAILALGVDVFLAPPDIVTGGVTGIGLIVRYFSEEMTGYGIPLSVTNLVVNIPILLVGWLILGRKVIFKTAVATLSLSFFLFLFEDLTYVGDTMLAAVYGGVLSGVGLGLVFTAQGTTGGTDTIAAIVQHYVPHFSISNFLTVIDGVIVLGGVLVFGVDKMLYALIAVFITTSVSGRVVDGMHYSKAVVIISDRHEAICRELLDALDRGVTGFFGRGMYTSRDKMILLCTCSAKESVMVKRMVHEIDPAAFMIVVDAREVLGEGFIEENA